jgi:hypothetical protein
MIPSHFYIFVIISPLKRTSPFIWRNLNPLHQRIICTKFDWLWPAGFREEDFFKKFSVFLLFHYYLPLEKAIPLPLNKLELPLPKDDLCQVWLKLVQWFWRRGRKCKSLQTNRWTDRTDGRQDRQMDARQPEKLTWAFSSGELKNDWILLSWKYAHLLMIVKHCTKFQVSTISRLRAQDFVTDGQTDWWTDNKRPMGHIAHLNQLIYMV